MDTPEVAPVASEPVSAPPVTESAPVPEPSGPRTTADIVSQVVNEAEAKSEVPPPAQVVTQEELSEAAKYIVSKGHKWGKREGSNADLSYLPASNVAKMLEGYAEQRVAAQEARLTAAEKERQRVEADLTEYINALKGDPRAFLETVAQADPRYKSFLTPQQAAQQAIPQDDPRPALILDQGAEKYTQSLDALLDWKGRQTKREAVAEAQAPYAEREKAEKQRIAEEQAHEQIRVKVKGQMEEAQSWPLFGAIAADGALTPFQQQVFDIYKADPKMSLPAAYIKASASKMAADDATRRAEYAKELNSAPKSTSMARTGVDAVSSSQQGPRKTVDVVRETVNRLEGS